MNNLSNWSDEFDRKFNVIRVIDKTPRDISNVVDYLGNPAGLDLREDSAHKAIKDFIRQTLLNQRKEIEQELLDTIKQRDDFALWFQQERKAKKGTRAEVVSECVEKIRSNKLSEINPACGERKYYCLCGNQIYEKDGYCIWCKTPYNNAIDDAISSLEKENK